MIGLCDRWHCLPSQVLAEPARALWLLDVYRQGHREDEEDEDADAEGGD